MSKALVIEFDKINAFARGDGVETRLMVGTAVSDAAPFTSGTTTFPAGCAAPKHSHNCAEQVTILEGQAEALIGEELVNMGPMDTSFIPANVPHYFRNAGDGNLTILWVYGAKVITRTFTDTGETVAHLSQGDQV